jgi:hypothetical protein
MTIPSNIPCRDIRGQIGHLKYYGRNQYGPFVTETIWEVGARPGWGGVRAEAVMDLAAVWQGLTTEQKSTWKRLSDRFRLTLYIAFLKINIPRYLIGLEPIETYD